MFYHSLISDWNHGNAHFLRGIVTELIARGHEVRVYEPANGWSLQNLLLEEGPGIIDQFRNAYPKLESTRYQDDLDLDRVLGKADLVIVHEWNDPKLIRRIAEHRLSNTTYRLLFHDTHHRAITQPDAIASFSLPCLDGVLAFGEALRALYLERGWADRVWTWHEAADTRVFRPLSTERKSGDLVWIGNWGDEERSPEIEEFLLNPVKRLGVKTKVYGVRYPAAARAALSAAGIEYSGWIANYRVPEVFAHHRVTVHIPRRPYRDILRGIPTIRVFEALACGIPLISSPWQDAEALFRPGEDFLVAQDGREMTKRLREVLNDEGLGAWLSENGRKSILARHTCAHRVDELLGIAEELGVFSTPTHKEESYAARK